MKAIGLTESTNFLMSSSVSLLSGGTWAIKVIINPDCLNLYLGLPLLVVPFNVYTVNKVGAEAGDENVEQF